MPEIFTTTTTTTTTTATVVTVIIISCSDLPYHFNSTPQNVRVGVSCYR